MKYSLRQLEVFIAIATYGNVSRAADSLAMSQSAASGALAELEKQFDMQLFDRVGKRLKINDMGLAVRASAQALLDQAQALQEQFERQTHMGSIDVGATLTIGDHVVVPIMAAFMAEYPGSRVHLEIENTQHIVDRVLNFELDIGLIEGELQHEELEITRWRNDELVVFARPEHDLVGRKLNDKLLRSAPWVMREQGSGTRQTFDRAMHDLLPDLNVVMELQHTEAIKTAVHHGLGIGCLSRLSVEREFNSGSLVELKTPGRDLTRAFYFLQHKKKYVSEGLANWIRFCQRAS